MSRQRKRHSAEFKAKVALEALKGLKTITELARDFEIHPTQINQWKQQLWERAPALFGRGQRLFGGVDEVRLAALCEKIARLSAEVDRLKRKSDQLTSSQKE
jgi:transposase-like protein